MVDAEGSSAPACPGCATPAAAFSTHDHAHCAAGALARAGAVVRARGLRLTPVRERTLQILLESHRALGAYDVLHRLAAEGFGNQPPVAYRALDFLEEHGLAHRIRRLNAFAACLHPGEVHAPVFLICTACNRVAEAPGTTVSAALTGEAATFGFAVERMTVEALGRCPACQAAA